MKAEEIDADFSADERTEAALGLSKIKRTPLKQRRVNVDFPTWMIESLDREATRLGVTRQSIIKIWLAERLESTAQ